MRGGDKTRLDLSRFLNEAPGDEVREPEDSAEAVFLAECDDQDWERILRHCDRRSFRRGEEIVRDGEVDRALLILTQGTLEFVSGERTFNVIAAPSVVGEVTFFDGAPRSGSLRARTDGEYLRLSFDSFEALSAELPALARTILLETGRILALRLRRATRLGAQ
jgi:CRP/FNR family cyclic AMP-dependent transcriptional regulator